jgi:hypothetical protein
MAEITQMDVRSIEQGLSKLREADSLVSESIKGIQEIRSNAQELLSTMQLQELREHCRKMLEVEESLRKVLGNLEELMR